MKFKNFNDTSPYWLVLNLRMKGLGYRRISKLTGIPKWTVRNWYEGRCIPRSVRRDMKFKNVPYNWTEMSKSYLF